MPALRADCTYYLGRPKLAGRDHYFLTVNGLSQCRKARAADCLVLTQVTHFVPDRIGVCVECARRQPRPATYYATAEGGSK